MSDSLELREQLLAIGFGRYNGPHASGEQANNKLELGYPTLAKYPEVLERVVAGICDYAEPYEPEFVVGVPHGATGLAAKVASQMDLYYIQLDKSEGEITYAQQTDGDNMQFLSQGIMVEDVLNRLTNTARALRLRAMAPKIAAVIGVFDRGMLGRREPIEQPIHSLVSLPIGAQLPTDHFLFKRYAL